jgi:hypothetical protein
MGVGPPFIVAFTPMAWAMFGADKATVIAIRIEIDAIENDANLRFLIPGKRMLMLYKERSMHINYGAKCLLLL